MNGDFDAYLDIETTGLSCAYDNITVVGICRNDGACSEIVQFVGDGVTEGDILEALSGAGALYTYNGSGFDLPFIKELLGTDLAKLFKHRDLMHDCWKRNLYGGLKAVEKKLGIGRDLPDVHGLEAVRLWWQYRNNDDRAALEKLLHYNREDVINLVTLRRKLADYCP